MATSLTFHFSANIGSSEIKLTSSYSLFNGQQVYHLRFENLKSWMRISAHENNKHGHSRKVYYVFSDIKSIKMANFRLLVVGRIGKQSVPKLNICTISCLGFGQFGRGTVA